MAVSTAPPSIPETPERSGSSRERTRGRGRRPSRNLPTILLGALLVLGCGLASAGLYASAGDRTSVLAVRQDIAVGTRVEEADLAQVSLSVGSELNPIPVDQRSSVVGKVARTGLVAGTLLGREHLVDRPELPPGQSVVAVLLDFGRVPFLEPGQEVVVVAAADGLNGRAQVYAVDPQGSSQAVRVSLLADDETAMRIAEVATTAGDISLVLPGSGS